MPQTINGVGTTYYGKSKVQRRSGVCENCGQEAHLASYDTRLWFVVLFIPIIPLGRKRILDYCPRCTSHRAMDLAKWQEVERQAIGEGMKKLDQAPDDPDAAIEMLGTLAAFQRRDEALELAETIRAQHASNPEVLFAVGGLYEHLGRSQAADELFAEALALAPEDPKFQRAVGLTALEQGDLDRAEELILASLDQPGDHREPSCLWRLAVARQARGDHPGALAVFAKLKEHFGDLLATNKEVRKAVLASEKKVGAEDSLLPPRRRNLRPVYAGAAAMIGGLVLLGGVLWYMQSHQTLHVVNWLPIPAEVVAPDGTRLQAPVHGRKALTLPAGTTELQVRCGAEAPRTVTVRLPGGVWQALTAESVAVLNVKGAAVLVRERAVYGGRPDQEGSYSLHTGREFQIFNDIDFAFEPFPRSLSSSSPGAEYRTRVSVLNGPPARLLGALQAKQVSEGARLGFLETHLAATPGNPALTRAYFALVSTPQHARRGRDFLAAGLDRRPVDLEWHRCHQNCVQILGEAPALLETYRAMAEAEPENADVLYLAGRLEPRSEPARALYRRALAVDPQHAHAHYALGYDFLSRGEYRRARPHLAAACERRDNTEFHHLHFLCRLGLEEYDALAAEQEDAVSASPTDFLAMRRLLQVRWLQGQTDALPQRVDAYAAAVTEALDGDPFGIAGVLRWDLAYLREESGELLPLAATLTPPDLRRHFRVAARLCREDLPGAEELLAEGTPADGNTCLLMALAWRLAEGTEQAAAWETRLAEEWNRPGTEMAQGRELLTAAGPVPLARLQEVALVPDQKRTLSALLALKAGPGQGGELAALAERLNVSPLFPHRLVARAVARVRDDGAPAAATEPAAGAGTETDTNAAKERP